MAFILLSFMPWLIALCSKVSRSPCQTSYPWKESSAPPTLVQPTDLLRVHLTPASKSLMEMFSLKKKIDKNLGKKSPIFFVWSENLLMEGDVMSFCRTRQISNSVNNSNFTKTRLPVGVREAAAPHRSPCTTAQPFLYLHLAATVIRTGVKLCLACTEGQRYCISGTGCFMWIHELSASSG